MTLDTNIIIQGIVIAVVGGIILAFLKNTFRKNEISQIERDKAMKEEVKGIKESVTELSKDVTNFQLVVIGKYVTSDVLDAYKKENFLAHENLWKERNIQIDKMNNVEKEVEKIKTKCESEHERNA
jgi:hypothetical protein